MPATYAHFRFGKGVRKDLKGSEAAEVIAKHPELFQIGLHGPDLLFYYHPLSGNPVNRLGNALHRKSGKAFSKRARAALQQADDKTPYLAYWYGVLCHFVLDVYCHGYIGETMQLEQLSHSVIETEFDRMLLVHDGYEPVSKKLTDHIRVSRECAEIISRFYPEVTVGQILSSLRGMRFFCNLLVAPSMWKRKLLRFGMRITGNTAEMPGMIMPLQPRPVCKKSNRALGMRYRSARKKAAAVILQWERATKEDELFSYNFESEREGSYFGLCDEQFETE